MDKGETKGDLVALRREICRRFIIGGAYRFVELPDPTRAADGEYTPCRRRLACGASGVVGQGNEEELEPGGIGAFLAWGDPSLYDSTLRILEARHVELDYDVIPASPRSRR